MRQVINLAHSFIKKPGACFFEVKFIDRLKTKYVDTYFQVFFSRLASVFLCKLIQVFKIK
jgi:hypothetical protein